MARRRRLILEHRYQAGSLRERLRRVREIAKRMTHTMQNG